MLRHALKTTFAAGLALGLTAAPVLAQDGARPSDKPGWQPVPREQKPAEQKPTDQRPAEPKPIDDQKPAAADDQKPAGGVSSVGLRGALAGEPKPTGSPLIISEKDKAHYDKTLAERLAEGRTLTEEEQRNVATATDFYKGLSGLDYEGIKATLAEDVQFSDEAYPELKGDEVRDMWKFITESKPEVTFKVHDVQGDTVYGSWVADYEVFGRPIHNVIQSKLTMKDGKIVAHRDDYDFKLWARQALPGPIFAFLDMFGDGGRDAIVRWIARQAF